MKRTDGPRPFIKSAGGKWSLLPQLRPMLPPINLWRGNGYRETFLGGGAMFFGHAYEVRPAVLADANKRLIDTFIAVRDCVHDVIDELRTLPHREDVYYAVRARFNAEHGAPLYERAAWFIFLNKTCVNGLYRENKSGDFNVSFGDYTNPTICDAPNLLACSKALQGTDIRHCDFAEALVDVRPGELVFADPVYVPLPGKKSFTQYIARPFTSAERPGHEAKTDHERLATWLRYADNTGAYVVTTNSDTAEARRVFGSANGWRTDTTQARRNVNSDGDGRGPVPETVFRNARTVAAATAFVAAAGQSP